MFERYTQAARAAIFGARYMASQAGSPQIETEHLLLGVLRTDKTLANRFLGSPWAAETVWNKVEQWKRTRKKVRGSSEIPLDEPSKRALVSAAKEADALLSKPIGTQHLLLGLLCVENSLAAQILSEFGVHLVSAREDLSRTPHDDSKQGEFVRERPPLPKDLVELRSRVESLRARVSDAIANRDFDKARTISEEEGAAHDKLVSLYRQHGLLDWIYE